MPILILFFWEFFFNHDIYPNPRPTTSTHSPLHMIHDTYLHSLIMYLILFLLSCLQPKFLGISSISIIFISTWNDKLFFNQSFSNLWEKNVSTFLYFWPSYSLFFKSRKTAQRKQVQEFVMIWRLCLIKHSTPVQPFKSLAGEVRWIPLVKC